MGLVKAIFGNRREVKFLPSDPSVNWERINTLVHGPGAPGWELNGSKDANSAVFACLMAIATSYPEPSLAVYRRAVKGTDEKLDEHPMQLLFDEPTPDGGLSIDEILFWTAWAKHTDGNAYWLKARAGNENTGNVVELWPVSPTLISPVTEPGDFISWYRHQIGPGKFERIEVNNVVHFRLGVDDRDHRKGLSPLKALARQVSTDDEADIFVSQLLQNYAVPGLVVVPSAGTFLDENDADRLTDRLRQKFGSDNRGNIAVMSKESTVEQFGFSPKDMDMSVLHRIPEERISAVMGVPAIVAGLGAGLDRATYDNARSMGEWFTERKLVPQWRSDGKKISSSLRPDFSASDRRIYVAFDLTDVRALQEDEDSKYTRLKSAVGKPWMTRNEAREDIGLDPIDSWDEEDVAPPEPEPVIPAVVPGTNGTQPVEEEETEEELSFVDYESIPDLVTQLKRASDILEGSSNGNGRQD